MKEVQQHPVSYSLSYLESIDSNPEFIRSFSTSVIDKINEHFSIIENATHAGRVDIILSELHQLKSYSLIYALDACRSKIEAIESAMKLSPQPPLDPDSVAAIVGCFNAFCTVLKRDLNIPHTP